MKIFKMIGLLLLAGSCAFGQMSQPPRWEQIQGNPADSPTLTIFTTNTVVIYSSNIYDVAWVDSVLISNIVANGTVTITRAMGPNIALSCAERTTIAFDVPSYPTNGNAMVSLGVWCFTNAITYDSNTIDLVSSTALTTLNSNTWNDLIFRKGYGGTNFVVRQ